MTDTPAGEQRYKLPAGSMVLYPSSTRHRVEPVTRGQLFEREGKSHEFDLVTKSLVNLQRLWMEI